MELERVNREAPQMSEVYLWKGHCLTMMAVDLSDPQDSQTQGAVAAYKTAVELMPGAIALARQDVHDWLFRHARRSSPLCAGEPGGEASLNPPQRSTGRGG
ncbi:MAG: hypothetical protein HY784_00875 [Chloroflexi bacterium]|nr:hypothetical protein [Chloroflexota bacterium]